jgi:hypothetical protein
MKLFSFSCRVSRNLLMALGAFSAVAVLTWSSAVTLGPQESHAAVEAKLAAISQVKSPTETAVTTLPASGPSAAQRLAVEESYGRLPLHFIENRGQVDETVRFYERGHGHGSFFTRDEIVFSFTRKPRASESDSRRGTLPGPGHARKTGASEVSAEGEGKPGSLSVLRLQPVGMNKDAEVVAEEVQAGTVNYFIGKDPAKWRTGIRTALAVRYKDAWPGIDLRFYGNVSQLEYDVIVKPGADPSVVKFQVQGADRLVAQDNGDLVFHMHGREFIQKNPVIYQEIDGKRITRKGGFTILESTGAMGAKTQSAEGPAVEPGAKETTRSYAYAFRLEPYDTGHPLVIDPILAYSTYLGGDDEDVGRSIAVDSAGNAYVTGWTYSLNFPVASALFANTGGNLDAFVTKLNTDGSALVYSTYLGGSDDDYGASIAVDTNGNAYVTGSTYSTDFPIASAFQAATAGGIDVFVTKLDNAGSALVYSTYLGGSGEDRGAAIAVDTNFNAYVTGSTYSTAFPTLNDLNGGLRGYENAFVTKFNAAGSALVYSTYLGGTAYDEGRGIAVDSSGNAYVTGVTYSLDFPTTVGALELLVGGFEDAFVTKINAAGSALVYSTYLGGSDDEEGYSIAVDTAGNAYVTGYTSSADFPTANALYYNIKGTEDAFVTKINPAGSALVYSTYLGGSGADKGNAIAVDAVGNAYVAGWTSSSNYPTANAPQASFGGNHDAFVTKINAVGTGVVFSSYLGGSAGDEGYAIAVDVAGNAYVTGITSSANFPTANALYPSNIGSYDSFVTKVKSRTATDFNANGLADILWFNSSTGEVYTWLMNGTTISSQGSVWTLGASSPWQIVGHGDFNGDENEDILLYDSSSGQVYIWLMNGTAIIGAGSPWTLGPGSPWAIAGVGDFNGDGKSDILLFDSSTGQVYTWLMNGTIIIGQGSPWTLGPGSPWAIAGVGDFNGDGKSDILLHDSSSGQVYVWLMSGAAIIDQGSVWILGAGSTWQIAGVGDFNGDGKSDILLHDSSSGQVYVWLMSGAAIIDQGSVWTLGASSTWQIAGVGDFNGDGKSDILLHDSSSGQVYVWLMNGAAIIGQGSPGTLGLNWAIKNNVPYLP